MQTRTILGAFAMLCSTLLFATEVAGQGVFGRMPPNNLTDIENRCVISKEVSIDSINALIVEKLPKNPFENRANPYWWITFRDLNQQQIDSAITLLQNRKYIVGITFAHCPIKNVPFMLRQLKNLHSLEFQYCDSIISMNGLNSARTIFSLTFFRCRIKSLPEGVEQLQPMLRLILEFPDKFNEFNLNAELKKFSRRKNVIDLYVRYPTLRIFPTSLYELTFLQTLAFLARDTISAPNLNRLVNLNVFAANDCDEKTYNALDSIGVCRTSASIEELSETEIEKVKEGTSEFTEDEIIWMKEHAFDNREIREFWYSHKKPKVQPSVQVLFETGVYTVTAEKHKFDREFMRIIRDKKSIVLTERRKYAFNQYEVLFVPDTSKKTLKIDIVGIAKSDSIRIELNDFSREVPQVYALDYQKGERTLELKDLPFIPFPYHGSYYLSIEINGTIKTWQFIVL